MRSRCRYASAAALLLSVSLVSRARAATPQGAFWRPLGPGGGNVTALAVFPSNPEVVYVAVQNGGIYVGVDGGETMRGANLGLESLNVYSLAVSPGSASVALAGTASGLFRTSDGGESWVRAAGGHGVATHSIVFDPLRPDTVYAVDQDGWLGKSTDRGATWEQLGDALAQEQPVTIAVNPARSNVLYLGTLQQGLLRSDDGGGTWTEKNEGMLGVADSRPGVTAIAVDPTEPSRIIASTNSRGVFVSRDGAESWQQDPGIAYSSNAVIFDADGTAYLGNQSAVLRLRRGETTWTRVTDSLLAVGVNALALGARPTKLLLATALSGAIGVGFGPGGLVLVNGGEARRMGAGIQGDTVNTLAWERDGSRLLGGSPNGLLVYGGGESRLSPMEGILDLVFAEPAGTLYAGSVTGVLRSTDGGGSWISISNGFPVRGAWVDSVLVPSESGDAYLAGTTIGLYRSTDQAASWSLVGGMTAVIFGLASEPGAGGVVYAATVDGVFRSSDAGATWTSASAGMTGGPVFDVAVAGGFVFAAARDGVYRSGDHGARWELLTGALPARQPHALAYDASTSTVYAGTYAGVWQSQNSGATWSRVGAGPPNPQIVALAVLPGGRLAAGALAGGAYVFEGPQPRGSALPPNADERDTRTVVRP